MQLQINPNSLTFLESKFYDFSPLPSGVKGIQITRIWKSNSRVITAPGLDPNMYQ